MLHFLSQIKASPLWKFTELNKQTKKQTNKETNKQTNKQINKASMQASKQASKQAKQNNAKIFLTKFWPNRGLVYFASI